MAMAPAVNAATRYSVASGDWSSTATWSATAGGASGVSAPVASDDVFIVGGFNVTVSTVAACTSITYTNTTGSTLTISATGSLTVSGTVTLARNNPGTNLLSIAGNMSLATLAFTGVSNSAGGHQVTISTGTLTVTGNVTVNATSKPSSAIVFTGAGTLKLGGSIYPAADGGLTTFAGSTVEYNSASAQNIGNFTYRNLTLSGANAKTIPATQAITVNEILSLEGTATISTTGTLNYGASATLQYNTSTARTTSTNEWAATFTPTGGVIIRNTGAITLDASKTISGPLDVKSGAALNLSTFGLSGANAVNLQCGAASSGSSITGTGTLTLGGNIVVASVAAGTAGATISAPIALGASRTFDVGDDGTAATDLTVSGVVSGAFGVTKIGAGALTLSNANTFTGGTTLTTGRLNINNASALGTTAGTFTINGGSIDNTSGSAITTSAYPMTWGGNFTFVGSNDLDLSTGTVSMTSNVQVTTSAKILTVGGALNAPTFNLTKAGAGSLFLGSNAVTVNALSITAGTFKTTSNTLTIKGAYSNAGTFQDNLGVVHFNGTAAQSIPLNGFNSTINTIKINNAAGVTLGMALVVNNLDLTLGNIDLVTNDLTVNTSITGGSGTSYVKTSSSGMLNRSIANTVTRIFPVGNSAYNPVSITNNSGATDAFTVRVFDEVYVNGFTAPATGANRVVRTWDINKQTANGGSGIDFNFNWNAGEEVGSFTKMLWHYDGTKWVKQTGTTSAVGTTLTYTGYTGTFSPFAIIDALALVPVVITDFNLQKVNNTTLVKWNTRQEQNSKDFIIQHSTDGTDWTNVGLVLAAGYSSSLRTYSFIHANPTQGKNLYRIMQRDEDGKATFTTILYLSFDEKSDAFTVLSNPVKSGQLKVNSPAKAIMRLYNNHGQLLRVFNLASGVQVIDVSGNAAGVYHVESTNQLRTIILQ